MKLEARDGLKSMQGVLGNGGAEDNRLPKGLKLDERPFQGPAEHSDYYDNLLEVSGPSLVSRVRRVLTVENVSAATSLALVLGGVMTGYQTLILPGLGTAAVQGSPGDP